MEWEKYKKTEFCTKIMESPIFFQFEFFNNFDTINKLFRTLWLKKSVF